MKPQSFEERREDAVARSGFMSMSRDPELAAIVIFTAAKYKASLAGLSIITGSRQVLIATVGTELTETTREASFCTTTIQRPGEALVVSDARRDERFANLATVTGEPFVRFYAGVPIVDRNGYPFHSLAVHQADKLAPSPTAAEVVSAAVGAEWRLSPRSCHR